MKVCYRGESQGTSNCVLAGCEDGLAFFSPSNPSGNCVEVACTHGARFKTSSHNGGSCVEAAHVEAVTFGSASTVGGQCVEAGHVHEAGLRSGSFANHNCVQAGHVHADPESASNSGNCVQAQAEAAGWVVRDSKGQGLADDDVYRATHLHFTAGQWADGHGIEFVPVLAADVPERVREVARDRGHEPQVWYSVTDGTDMLWFDFAEALAFRSGVQNGTFRQLQEANN